MANYNDIKLFDVLNGEGTRHSLFVSGCQHYCKGCFNKNAWDYNYGNSLDDEAINIIINHFNTNRPLQGISLLGGEPMDSARTLLKLVKKFKIKYPDKDVWLWSGYLFEEIRRDKSMNELLEQIDVLIDGKFVESKKDLTLKFRGSSNQRIIDVQKSLINNQVVLWEDRVD